jgi:hypothetical protein
MTMDEIIAAGRAKARELGLIAGDGGPGLLTKAKNLATATAKHVSHGLPTVTDEERDRRLAICGGCEFRTEAGTCRKCGCGLKTKASWALQHCPLNPPKW